MATDYCIFVQHHDEQPRCGGLYDVTSTGVTGGVKQGSNGIFLIHEDDRHHVPLFMDACTSGCGALMGLEAYHSWFPTPKSNLAPPIQALFDTSMHSCQAKLLCHNIPKQAKNKHTLMDGPKSPTFEDGRHS